MIELKKEHINNPKLAYEIFQKLLNNEDSIAQNREHFWVMCLDTRTSILSVELVALGGLNTIILVNRDIFRRATIQGANSIIVCHNHPSGDITPSSEDIDFTKRISQAGELLGIQVNDHIIISTKAFYSMKEKGDI